MFSSHFNHFLSLLQDESRLDAIEQWEVALNAQAAHVRRTGVRYEGPLLEVLALERYEWFEEQNYIQQLIDYGKEERPYVFSERLCDYMDYQRRAGNPWEAELPLDILQLIDHFVVNSEEYQEEEWQAYLYETRPDDYGVNHSYDYFLSEYFFYAYSSDESDDDFVDRAELEEEAQQYAEEYYAQQEEEERRKTEAANERAEEDEDDYECYYDEFDHESSLRAVVARHSHKSFDCDW